VNANITEPSWKATHTTGCTAGLCFNWESGHSKEVFLASQGNLLLVKESFQTANWIAACQEKQHYAR
jgi:hypothetical protein